VGVPALASLRGCAVTLPQVDGAVGHCLQPQMWTPQRRATDQAHLHLNECAVFMPQVKYRGHGPTFSALLRAGTEALATHAAAAPIRQLATILWSLARLSPGSSSLSPQVHLNEFRKEKQRIIDRRGYHPDPPACRHRYLIEILLCRQGCLNT